MVPHPAYLGLADSPQRRLEVYHELFEAELDPNLINDTRCAARNGRPMGCARKSRKRAALQVEKYGPFLFFCHNLLQFGSAISR